MQIIVFVAFAIALSVPLNGPPWQTVARPEVIWATVAAQVLLPALVAWLYVRLVLHRLEVNPAWLPDAQERLSQGGTAIRGVLVAELCFLLYGTGWGPLVRSWPVVGSLYGLDELVLLAPFFLGVVLSWFVLYPADRAVREVAMDRRLLASVPMRPVWNRRAFLSFMIRQNVLIILIPMLPILIANDFVAERADWVRRFTRVAWGDQALLVLIAGVVFLFAPVALRHIWHTRPLPAGDLRERLEAMSLRAGFRSREILIWESDGMVVNAAVMGIVRPLRYVLLSDGLIEMMEDRKIEAVFGHEVGHVRHHHMLFYLLFTMASMLAVGGVIHLAVQIWPQLLHNRSGLQDYFQVVAMAMIILIWVLGFGIVSRRFEWQSDLFGARSITPPAEECDQPCLFHGTAIRSGPDPDPPALTALAVCATGVEVFAKTLESIANLNGIPVDARSWRHSSISNRVSRLRSYANDPTQVRRLNRNVLAIKILLFFGTLIGLAIGVYLYWLQAR
ncbi:MAG: M48 family metalloprotease [Phycisphaerae bacterium]|nr:M48 family metalloprotease [Phycisphaerae bacterium]